MQELQKQKLIDDKINSVFDDQDDEEFKKALRATGGSMDDKTPSKKEVSVIVDTTQDPQALVNLGGDRYQLQLDGFELGKSTASHQETGFLGNSFSKKKKKTGLYEVESIEKLKEKGYNLFSELTQGMGSSFHVDDPYSSPSNVGRQKTNDSLGNTGQLPKVIESSIKKGKKAKFFKEFVSQHKNTVDVQIQVLQEVFGPESPLVAQCKDLVYSVSPSRRKKNDGTNMSPSQTGAEGSSLIQKLSTRKKPKLTKKIQLL